MHVELDIIKSIFASDKTVSSDLIDRYGEEKLIKKSSDLKIKNIFLRKYFNHKTIIQNYLSKVENMQKLKLGFAKKVSQDLMFRKVNHSFFKGIALSNNCYNFITDRPFFDLDFVVDKKCLSEFYGYLDFLKIKHKSNYKYFDRLGFTRNALEVLDTRIGVPLDCHHRITNKSFTKNCYLSYEMLANSKLVDGLVTPTSESLICSTLYHATIQNKYYIGPIYLIDIFYLMQMNLDTSYLLKLIKKNKLEKQLTETQHLLDSLVSNKLNNSEKNFLNKLISLEKRRKKPFFPMASLKSLLCQLIDPEPYINIQDGNKKKIPLIEYGNLKFKEIKKKLN